MLKAVKDHKKVLERYICFLTIKLKLLAKHFEIAIIIIYNKQQNHLLCAKKYLKHSIYGITQIYTTMK